MTRKRDMSLLDRLLPLWILLAMITGLLLGRLIPGLDTFLDSMSVGGISLCLGRASSSSVLTIR